MPVFAVWPDRRLTSNEMAGTEENCPDMPDPLRVQRCPDCGYMLCGLPAEGICPECGAAYEPEMIVLYGWEHGLAPEHRRWLRWVQAGLHYWWILYVPFAVWLWPWTQISKRPSVTQVAVMLGLAIPLVIAVWDALRDRPARTPAPVQLRLTPKGFAMREGIGPAPIRPWLRQMDIGLDEIREDWFLLYSKFEGMRITWWPGLEIKCDTATARRIRQRVERWCSQAKEFGRIDEATG